MIGHVIEALKERIRQTVAQGKAIAILGWKASNHNKYTRSLSDTRVIFCEAGATPPDRVGFTLLTRFVKHTHVAHLRRERVAMHAVPIDLGKLKKLLAECKDVLAPSEARAVPLLHVEEAVSLVPQETESEILDYLTTPQQESTAMQRFAIAFMAAGQQTDGYVGAKTVAKLSVEYGVSPAAELARTGWLIAERAEGKKKIGWYRASSKLIDESRRIEQLPNDPLERARRLIATRSEVTAQKDALLQQVKVLDGRLELIDQAEALVKQLEQLVS